MYYQELRKPNIVNLKNKVQWKTKRMSEHKLIIKENCKKIYTKK